VSLKLFLNLHGLLKICPCLYLSDMHKTLFLFFSLCLLHLGNYGQEPLLGNAYNRSSTSLNGVWNYIVDPYENGYYNYRYTAFDQEEHTSVNAYFTNSKPKDKTAPRRLEHTKRKALLL